MTRRKFIIGLIAGALTIIGGVVLLTPFHEIAGRILRDQLAFLKIQDGAIRRFTEDISANRYYEQKNFGWKKQLFVKIYRFLENPWITIPGKARYDRYCTFFVSDFLLSTDFFLYKMDESRPVNYIALYEPYKRPCSNPFSNLFYAAA